MSCPPILTLLPAALLTPEANLAVLALHMASQRARGIKPGVTVLGAAHKGGHVQVGDAHVAPQGLVLAEAEAAAVVAAAAEALGALVDGSVAAQAGGRDEGLAAARLLARVLLLVGVRAFDVLRQVLLLGVRFVARRVRALVRAVVDVRPQVGGQAGWAVKSLGTARECTLDGLEVRGTEVAVLGGEWASVLSSKPSSSPETIKIKSVESVESCGAADAGRSGRSG